MNKKNYKLLFSALLTMIGIGTALTPTEVNAAYDKIVTYNCNPSKDTLKNLEGSGFNKYMDALGVKTSIKVKGSTFKINRDIATDKCLIVYGKPKDVKLVRENPYDKKTAQYKYLGFDVNGNPYPNIEYPEFGQGEPENIDYVQTRKFIKEPWNHTGLKKNIGTKPTPKAPSKNIKATYVDPKTGKKYTEEDELNRAVDRFYLQYCGKKCNLGNRGYFPKKNTVINKVLNGKNLLQYASVQSYPTKFTAGTFDLYHNTNGPYWHATFYMPAHVTLFNEQRDLAIKITSLSTPVKSGKKFNVKYQVCNYGDTIVNKPVVTFVNANKNVTLDIKLESGKCSSTYTFTDTAPSVTKKTTKDYVVKVNKNGKNPEKESNTSNNTDSKKLTIEPLVKDLGLTIESIETPVKEGKNFKVKYTVCNKGEEAVKNPVVSYGKKGDVYKNVTIKTTLAAGKCTTQTVTDTAPSVSKQTKINYELTVNKDKKNPTNEKTYTNNTDNKTLTVNPGVRDLALTINTIETPVVEGEDFKVKYTVCNKGEVAVKNPVISYGKKGGKYKTTTIETTLAAGKCTTTTVTDTAPSVSKQTKIDYELIVNKDKKNPTNEKTFENNKDDKDLTVKKAVNDLKLNITKLPSPVIEGEKFEVTYKVCNDGNKSVKNPVVSYGVKGGEYQNTTIKTTLAPGKCTTQTVTDEAPTVSKDSTFDYELIVNKNKKNPTNEKDYSNNNDDKPLKVLDDIKNGSVTIKDHSPDVPHSNENITVKVEVCNHSLATATNVQVSYGFTKGEKAKSTIKSIGSQDCVEITHKTTTPVVNGPSGNVIYQATLDKFKGDSDSSDNKDTDRITVKNPDAKVTISTPAGSSSQVNDINVKFTNNMLNGITNKCGNTSGTIACKGNAPTGTQVKIYDTKFTDTTTDDVLVKTYYPTFSLEAGKSTTYKISSDVLVNYVQTNYSNIYQLVEFRVEAQMPHYKGEIDYKGNQSYDNNQDVETLVYSPKIPDVAKCNVLDHQISTYFTTPDGQNPIKMCAGHYPTYPSTIVESGMQAYHYVLYRFFPSPLPKYTVTTPGSNSNSFFQLYELPSTEEKNQLGDYESMFFPNKQVNGYYLERGRYLPTGGTFNFKVYENGGTGDTIALGTVSYKISSSCYNTEALDIKHQFGCDSTIFYLPNYDSISKHEKPNDYNTNNKVVYPIKGTKIPYLNPGSYTFEFKATETFKYYYQTNQSTSGYNWSNPKFK